LEPRGLRFGQVGRFLVSVSSMDPCRFPIDGGHLDQEGPDRVARRGVKGPAVLRQAEPFLVVFNSGGKVLQLEVAKSPVVPELQQVGAQGYRRVEVLQRFFQSVLSSEGEPAVVPEHGAWSSSELFQELYRVVEVPEGLRYFFPALPGRGV